MRSLLLLWALVVVGAPLVNGQVRVWEGTMPLAATDEGPADVNPAFDAFGEREDYPYTLRQSVHNTETNHVWRAVYLENEYLKCTILPDLGGHIYTCVDKIDGKPMFYANPTFKKALIGYRGAWSAFGVEFNFPISHNWVSSSPVDFAYSSAPDGSASVTVGNQDRVYGMEWTVQIVLRPGSTVLEEHVTLSNRSDLRHHYFWWNNAAVEVWNDSKIWYPMQFVEEGNIDSWPVDAKGNDLSVISKQIEGYVARFAYGTRESFMGVYNPHTDAGIVHYADHKELPGMKIWSWGVDKDGLDWRKTLSDNDSAYVEVQAGLFKDQKTFEFLEPRQVVRFSEFWMPVHGIGAISRANLSGVVSMVRETQPDGTTALAVGFNANTAMAGAKIVISDGEKSVYGETVSLDPAKMWTHRIASPAADKKYTFGLKNAKGESLLTHTEDTYDMTPADQIKIGWPPVVKAPDWKFWADADFAKSGTDAELAGHYLTAWTTYQAGLATFRPGPDLLKAAGRLAVELFRFEEAAKYLGKAEERAGSDDEIHYYRGVAEMSLGRLDDARTELEASRRSPAFNAAGGLLLAEMRAQNHDGAGALKLLNEFCPGSGDLRCVEETVALERSAGDTSGAKKLAGEALAKFPTSSFLRNELVKMGIPAPELDRHLAADSSRILSMVVQYNRLGMYADSVELLSRGYPVVAADETDAGAVAPASDPVLAYYRGFCKQKLGQSGQADFEAASHMPLLYVFPNEADTIPVLRAAIANNASDASAHFLLGTLLFSKGIVDPALDEWKQAAALNSKIPTLNASMGRALFEIKKKPADAVAVLQRGMQIDASDPALYLEMNKVMQQAGRTASQRADMMKTFPNAEMPTDLVRALVKALRESKRNDEAEAVLAGHFVPRKEGEAPIQPAPPGK